MNKVIKPIKDLLLSTDMTFDEVRAFSFGASCLDIENQVELYRYLNHDKTMIYPVYINFMARKKVKDEGADWKEAVEGEIKRLESYIEGKRVGDEVK